MLSCLELEWAGLNHFENDLNLLLEPMSKIAIRRLTESLLHPLAELLNASRIDPSLKVLLLLRLLISIPGTDSKLLKQLAVILIAHVCVLNHRLEFFKEDI